MSAVRSVEAILLQVASCLDARLFWSGSTIKGSRCMTPSSVVVKDPTFPVKDKLRILG